MSLLLALTGAGGGVTVACTAGDALATGQVALLNQSIATSVGNASATGVTALENVVVQTGVGNASAVGVQAVVSQATNVIVVTTPGDALAEGIPTQIVVGTSDAKSGYWRAFFARMQEEALAPKPPVAKKKAAYPKLLINETEDGGAEIAETLSPPLKKVPPVRSERAYHNASTPAPFAPRVLDAAQMSFVMTRWQELTAYIDLAKEREELRKRCEEECNNHATALLLLVD